MTQIENYFDDNGKNAGFKTVFDQLMTTGLQELMKNPNDATAKSQFVGYAGALAEYFNGVAANLQKLQKDVNQEIKLKIDEVNSLAGEIANLNKQINTIELTGVKANELRDRRTLLLDQLSQVVDVETKEIPVTDPNQPDRETGANRFIVRIAGGQTLVDDSEYNGLECVARTSYEKVNQTDIDGLYNVYWEDGQKFNLYNGAMGGALRGLIEMRDGNNAENFTGKITDTGTTAGGANDTVTVQVSKAYLQDLNKCKLSDNGGIINLGNQEFYYDSWTYQIGYDDSGEEIHTYTFVLSDQQKNPSRVTNDRVGKVANIGASITYQGVPYYMSQMNEWTRTFSQKLNDILTSGYDSNGNQGVKLFTGDYATDDKQYEFEDAYRYDLYQAKVEEAKKTYMKNDPALTEDEALELAKKNTKMTVGVSDDSYYQLTAMNFNILSAMELDPKRLANRYDKGDGVEQNDLLEDIKDLSINKEKMSFRGCSASEFLQCVLSDVALNAQRANTFYQNFKDVAGTIDTQRMSISGVDEDEEAVNLVKYQNGYNLASKMIQTLTEIYDRLILETGV